MSFAVIHSSQQKGAAGPNWGYDLWGGNPFELSGWKLLVCPVFLSLWKVVFISRVQGFIFVTFALT